MFIYKTTNIITGKSYVGQHIRNDPNYLGSGIYLNHAIKKYGKENFIREILEYCETLEELNEMEFHYIKQYCTLSPLGYNLTSGGDGGDTTLCMSPEKLKIYKENISKETKGEKHYLNRMSPEQRELYIQENMSGINHSTHRGKTEEEYQQYILENRCGINNAIRRGKTEEEFEQFVDKTYRGKNHYTARMTKEEYEVWHLKLTSKTVKHSDKTKALMSVSQRNREDRKKKFIITLPFNNTELLVIGIGQFCRYINNLKILDYKVNRKAFSRVILGEKFPRSHKGWAVREYDPAIDINIPKWENSLYINED